MNEGAIWSLGSESVVLSTLTSKNSSLKYLLIYLYRDKRAVHIAYYNTVRCKVLQENKYYEPRGFEPFFILTCIYSRFYSGKDLNDFLKTCQLSFSYFYHRNIS